jgi:hypothetical protein
MYAAAQAAGEGANGATGFTSAAGESADTAGDDTVVDAEVVDEGSNESEGSR